jgi:hypothetical protein
MNAGPEDVDFILPSAPPGSGWRKLVDTMADPPMDARFNRGVSYLLAAHSLSLFVGGS